MYLIAIDIYQNGCLCRDKINKSIDINAELVEDTGKRTPVHVVAGMDGDDGNFSGFWVHYLMMRAPYADFDTTIRKQEARENLLL